MIEGVDGGEHPLDPTFVELRRHPARPWRAEHIVGSRLGPVAHGEPAVIEHELRTPKGIGGGSTDEREVVQLPIRIGWSLPGAASSENHQIRFLHRIEPEIEFGNRVRISRGVDRHLDGIRPCLEITGIDAELLAERTGSQPRAGAGESEQGFRCIVGQRDAPVDVEHTAVR